MHRIDSSGAVDSKFQPGNPAIGQRATQIPYDWMNAVQEALCILIERAGLDLEKGNDQQVYDAVIALIAGVVGDGSGAVPTVRQILTAGLASGGGDLTVNRTITVPKASQAEASAGTDDTKALTPYAAAGLVGLNVSGGAWIIKVGPVVLQLFNGTAQANGTTVITLPQAYTDQCRIAFCNGGAPTTSAQENGPYVSGTGLTSVSIFNAVDSAVAVTILAIGK